MVYDGDDSWKGYQIRAWSSYASLLLLMFNNLSAVFFAEEMAMTLVNSAEPELNETQGYAISRSKLFTISLVRS